MAAHPAVELAGRPIRTLDELTALVGPTRELSIVLPRTVQAELDAARQKAEAGYPEAATAHLGIAAGLLRSKRMSSDDIAVCLGISPAEVRWHLPVA